MIERTPAINDPVLAVAVRAARRAAAVIGDAATLSAAFPDHAILTEESGSRAGAKGDSPYKWIVDPIDGTLNFIHGYPYYAVSIALAHGTELTHAVVLDPVHEELFTAAKGKGAQLNGAPIRTSTCVRIEDALVATVFPTRTSPRLAAYLPILNTLLGRCASVRRAGSCALDLAHLAAGRLDGFWVTSLKAWDVAAGALLVREAGGRVGDFAGGADFLRSHDVIAAAPGLFNPLREAIVAARPA